MRLYFYIFIILVSVLLSQCSRVEEKVYHPNLVFVFTDQMRKQSLGFLDEDPVKTPNLDEFAQTAQFISNAISNVPICSPYRAMLMTGRFPRSTGITTNLMPTHNYGLSEKEETFGEVLKRAGYQTAYIGKWHLSNPELRPPGITPEEYISENKTFDGPAKHGFDYVIQTFSAHKNKDAVYWENSCNKLNAEWSVDFTTDKAMEFIQNTNKEKPFALFLSWGPPHAPYVVPDKYREIYKNIDLTIRPNDSLTQHLDDKIGYFAGVTWCDDNFGKLTDFLDENNLGKNTIVVFTSDHGEMLGSHGIINEKTYWYEESLKIPFLIRWPGKIPQGTNNMLLPVHDFMPTILGLMNIEIPDVVEGSDWSENIINKSSDGPESAFIAHYPYMAYDLPWIEIMPRHKVINQGLKRREKGYRDLSQLGFRGITNNKYTYIIDRCPADEPNISFNWKEWKPEMIYLHYGKVKTSEFFYDNEKDPYQLNPISINSELYSNEIMNIKSDLKKWLDKMHDPFIVEP